MSFTCPTHGPYVPLDTGTTLALCPKCAAPKAAPVSAMQGWECPRCRAIHSPFTQRCGCSPPLVYGTNTGSAA